MKRFFKILGLLLIVLLAMVLLLPLAFKGELVQRAQSAFNDQVENATVSFGDIGLSLWQRFPDFQLSIHDFKIEGAGPYAGINLVELDKAVVEIDLASVLFGEAYRVEHFGLYDLRLDIRIDEEGRANYDIFPSGEEGGEEPDSTAGSSSFQLELRSYVLKNIHLQYRDAPGAMFLAIEDLDHRGAGDFSERLVDLRTNTAIASFTFDYEGLRYFDRTELASDFDLRFDQENFAFEFGNNNVRLNALNLKFNGALSMPDENIDLDLQLEAPDGEFKQVLSLVPAVYQQDFASVQTTGRFSLSAKAKGRYSAEPESYPTFDLNFQVSEASFRYPSLPAGVEDIAVDLRVSNARSDLDGTVIDLREARAKLADNPIRLQFYLENPLSDPTLRSGAQAKLDLANLARVVPARGYDYQGLVEADFKFAGTLSAIEAENYEAIEAVGNIAAQDLRLRGDSLPFPIDIDAVELRLSPQTAELPTFSARMANSDFQANGYLDNLVAYLFDYALLKGSFALRAGFIDLNALSPAESTNASAEAPTTPSDSSLTAIRLPQNIDFRLSAEIDTLLYSNMELRRMQGSFVLREGKALLENLSLETLGGQLAVNGSYNSLPTSPEVDLNFKIDGFSFAESYQKLSLVQRYAPIMKNTSGKYSTGFSFKGLLNPDMSPELSTIFAKGRLQTRSLETSGKTLDKIAQALKNPDLARLSARDVDLGFSIENGRLEVEPFDFKAGPIQANLGGSSGLDQSLDYQLNLRIPAGRLGAQNLLAAGLQGSRGMIPVGVGIGGTAQDPKITTDLGQLAKQIGDDLVQQGKQKVGEKVEEVKADAEAEAQALIDEAERKGDQLIAAAEAQAQTLRNQAKQRAQQLRAEGEKQAQKIEAEAKGNPLKTAVAKKAADQVRKEANDKANQVEREAENSGQQLIDEAKQKKAQLVADARNQANR